MPWRDRFGSDCGGPVLRQRRQGDDQGKLRGGDVPSRRVSPCTLLSYEGGFHSRWPQRRGEEGGFFFFLRYCAPDGPKWTAQNISECREEG